MLRSDGSRFCFFAALSLLAIMLAVLGEFAAAGFVGTGLLVIGVGFNVVGTLFAPNIIGYGNTSATVFFGAVATVVSLIVGCLIFGWWGLAYAVGSVVGYLLSSAFKR